MKGGLPFFKFPEATMFPEAGDSRSFLPSFPHLARCSQDESVNVFLKLAVRSFSAHNTFSQRDVGHLSTNLLNLGQASGFCKRSSSHPV